MRLLLKFIIILLTTCISISAYCEKDQDNPVTKEDFKRLFKALENANNIKGSYVTNKAFESINPLSKKRYESYKEWSDSRDALHNMILETNFFFWIFSKNKIKKAVIKEKVLLEKRSDTYNNWWYSLQSELDKASLELEKTLDGLYHKKLTCNKAHVRSLSSKAKSVDCNEIKKIYTNCLKSSIKDGRSCSTENEAHLKCMEIKLLSY